MSLITNEKFFNSKISPKQCSDTGMAMVLLLLLIAFFTDKTILYQLTIPVLVLNMIYPKLYYPVAFVWLGMANVLGSIMSKIILCIVFIVVVIPVSLIRKLLNKDSLQLTKFKKSRESVMLTRDHAFSAKDIEKPF